MATSLVSTGVQFPDSTIQTTAAGGGTVVFISSTTISSSTASVAFTGLSNSTYSYYILEFSNLYLTSDDTLTIRLSSDNGSTYLTTGYNGILIYAGAGVGQYSISNGSPNTIAGYAQAVGTAAANTCAGFIELHNVGVEGGIFTYRTGNKSSANYAGYQAGSGGLYGNATYNAFRLQATSANISAGKFYLYGVKKS